MGDLDWVDWDTVCSNRLLRTTFGRFRSPLAASLIFITAMSIPLPESRASSPIRAASPESTETAAALLLAYGSQTGAVSPEPYHAPLASLPRQESRNSSSHRKQPVETSPNSKFSGPKDPARKERTEKQTAHFSPQVRHNSDDSKGSVEQIGNVNTPPSTKSIHETTASMPLTESSESAPDRARIVVEFSKSRTQKVKKRYKRKRTQKPKKPPAINAQHSAYSALQVQDPPSGSAWVSLPVEMYNTMQATGEWSLKLDPESFFCLPVPPSLRHLYEARPPNLDPTVPHPKRSSNQSFAASSTSISPRMWSVASKPTPVQPQTIPPPEEHPADTAKSQPVIYLQMNQENPAVHVPEQEKCVTRDPTKIPQTLKMIGTRLLDFEREMLLIPDCLKDLSEIQAEIEEASSGSLILYTNKNVDQEHAESEMWKLEALKHAWDDCSVEIADIQFDIEILLHYMERDLARSLDSIIVVSREIIRKLDKLGLWEIAGYEMKRLECILHCLEESHPEQEIQSVETFQEDTLERLREQQSVLGKCLNVIEHRRLCQALLGLCQLAYRRVDARFVDLTSIAPVDEKSRVQSMPGTIFGATTCEVSSDAAKRFCLRGAGINPVAWGREFHFAVLLDVCFYIPETARRMAPWARACFHHRRSLEFRRDRLPIPMILFKRAGTFQMFYAEDVGTHATVTPWAEIGTTDTLRGWYQMLAVLCCLGEWVNTIFTEWFEETALRL